MGGETAEVVVDAEEEGEAFAAVFDDRVITGDARVVGTNRLDWTSQRKDVELPPKDRRNMSPRAIARIVDADKGQV